MTLSSSGSYNAIANQSILITIKPPTIHSNPLPLSADDNHSTLTLFSLTYGTPRTLDVHFIVLD